jgi:hypothetical protein
LVNRMEVTVNVKKMKSQSQKNHVIECWSCDPSLTNILNVSLAGMQSWFGSMGNISIFVSILYMPMSLYYTVCLYSQGFEIKFKIFIFHAHFDLWNQSITVQNTKKVFAAGHSQRWYITSWHMMLVNFRSVPDLGITGK